MIVISRKEELKEYIKMHQVSLYGVGKVGRSLIEWIEDNALSPQILNIYDTNRVGRVYGYWIEKLEEKKSVSSPMIISTKYDLAIKIVAEMKLKDQVVILSDNVCDELLDYMDNKYLIKLSNRIAEKIGKKLFWDNERERTFLLNNGWDILNTDIYNKYINLIKNLDVEGIEVINIIIARIKKVINSNCKKIDLFSPEEQLELYKIKNDFPSQILKINDNAFAFKNFILPINHFESSVFLYKHEIDILSNHKKLAGTTFIDAGGYIGDSVLVLEELKPKNIITFEAIEEHCRLIQQTIEMNNLNNVVIECKALGEEEGEIVMQVAGSGTNAIGRNGIEYLDTVSVPVITIDKYCDRNGIECVGLIKADIEGMESFMLKGASCII